MYGQHTFWERIFLCLEPDLHNIQRCDWKKAKRFSDSEQNNVLCTNTKRPYLRADALCHLQTQNMEFQTKTRYLSASKDVLIATAVIKQP